MKRLLCALLMVLAFPALGQRIRNVITIPIPLPANYFPPSLPTRPVDEAIRVCVVTPAFDPETSARWNAPTEWVDTGKGETPREDAAVDRVVLNFSEPLESVLPKIMKHLFPRMEVKEGQTSPPCELLLRFSVQSSDLNEMGRLQGVAVTGTVNAFAAGDALTFINASGRAERRKWGYWSTQTEARALGQPALQMMLDHLLERLVSDEKLIAYLKSKADERARPSDLEVTVKFDDSASFFPNGRLDAGEKAKLLLTIRNRGAGPAFGVRLGLSSANKGMDFPAAIDIGDIAAGATKDVPIAIAGALDVASAVQPLRVETLEKRGYGGRPVIVELATQQLKKPAIEIADISLNGRPANGDTIEGTVLVRNGGPGDAVGVHVVLESVPGVEIIDPKLDVGPIPANAVRKAQFRIRVPVTFAGTDLLLTVRAEETRGAQVAQASRTATWPLELKRPVIELTYRLFDGNSPDSRGDRDGVANNGEAVELMLTPSNRGTLSARDVSVTIAPRQPGVTVKPETFAVGDLPPLSEGAAQRVRITIPRTIGRDATIDELPFAASIAQRDFAANEQAIALPFAIKRPEIDAELSPLAPLIEGAPAAFALAIRNRGALPAEDVRVEISSDNSALELLDESSTPVRNLTIDAGTVAAQTTLPPIPVKAHVRRNLTKASASLALTVRQNDFPPVATQTALDIQREDATVVTIVPPPLLPPEAPPASTRAVPAISFQRYDNGDRVNEEAIGLRFEVQSQTALETVRLEQNHRSIDAGTPKVRGSAWQYEPRVSLDYGENLFEVIAVTTEGAKGTRSIIVNREKPRGRVWVAAVGISRYASKGIAELAFARNDAAAILEYYRQFGLPETQLISLFDEQATLGNLKRNLGKELVDKATNPEDTVILYFAGHGDRESDRGSIDADGYTKYLLPYDADPSDLFSSALSMEELTRIVQRLRAERVVLIIDSCFSGAAGGRTLFRPGITPRAPITDEFLARIATAGRGSVILTASSPQEVANEGLEWHHGVFTYYLLEALRGAADSDGDGRVDVDEVYKYVWNKVVKATNGNQTPVKRAPISAGTVIVGKTIRP